MDQLRVQSTFSDYYSSRIDSLFFVDNDNMHDYASQFNAANDEYWNKYQITLKMHQRVQQPPKNITPKYIERIGTEYPWQEICAELFKNSVAKMSFKVDPSSYFNFKFMSYYFGKSA